MRGVFSLLICLLLNSVFSLNMPNYQLLKYEREYDRFIKRFERWNTWTMKHNKHYKTEKELYLRFMVFSSNDDYINDHNTNYFSYKLGHNQFSDLTNYEYSQMLRSKFPILNRHNTYTEYSNFDNKNNESVDWRQHGS